MRDQNYLNLKFWGLLIYHISQNILFFTKKEKDLLP